MKPALSLCFFMLTLTALAVNGPTKDTSKIAKLKAEFEQQLTQGKDAAALTLKTQTTALANEQFKTMLARERQNQAEIADEQFDINHRQRSFDFQYTASIIIFIIVIVIVVTGLIFSGIQFRFSLKKMQLHDKLLDTVKGLPDSLSDDLKTELEFSKDGVKVNSSVLGVIVLVFSVAFFYLYLIYVYPIKYITPQDAAKITGTEQVVQKDSSGTVKHPAVQKSK